MIAHDVPLDGFAGKLAVDAKGVISVRSADWTESHNIRLSHGATAPALSSYYDFTRITWYLLYADGRVEIGTDPAALDDPDVVGLVTGALDLSAVAGPVTTASGDVFVTSSALGGLMDLPEPGKTTMLTLTLDVAGEPGAYEVTLAEAYAVIGTSPSPVITPGPALVVTVASE